MWLVLSEISCYFSGIFSALLCNSLELTAYFDLAKY